MDFHREITIDKPIDETYEKLGQGPRLRVLGPQYGNACEWAPNERMGQGPRS